MNLQYQLSNGNWVNCNDRTERFLSMCEQFNGLSADGKIVPIFRALRPLTRDEVVAALLAGRELRNDKNDWYSNCRSGSAYDSAMAARLGATPPVEMVKCSCGHITPRPSVMSASMGTSCPDCYDRMSD